MFIVGTDIGGTTFSSVLYDTALNTIEYSPKELIANFITTEGLISGICDQILDLERKHDLSPDDIMGIGLACPGPLDARSGMILNTPNLTLLQDFPIVAEIEKILQSKVYLENDANLFALGEWVYNSDRKAKVLVSITLGTGVGFGIVLNGQMYTGAHGMAAEYGISPVGKEQWEDGIAIRGLNKLSVLKFNRICSPKELFDLASTGDLNALEIWSVYGARLGLVLSHVINMLDPDVITIGGGISHAFPFFSESMLVEISFHSPAYQFYKTTIIESTEKEKSAMLGAAKLVKNNW
ncbi:MAG: ROK family protein [Candidatus Marinimicrobia bacterium]|nr:ROK family protein [Candidatus Neomarinimicrobiota bacterium]